MRVYCQYTGGEGAEVKTVRRVDHMEEERERDRLKMNKDSKIGSRPRIRSLGRNWSDLVTPGKNETWGNYYGFMMTTK